jgi:hypothetical protein
MPSNLRNKQIATVRVFKRSDRARRWYAVVRLPGRKAVIRSTRCDHRGSAEEYAALLLKHCLRSTPPRDQCGGGQ